MVFEKNVHIVPPQLWLQDYTWKFLLQCSEDYNSCIIDEEGIVRAHTERRSHLPCLCIQRPSTRLLKQVQKSSCQNQVVGEHASYHSLFHKRRCYPLA